MNLQQAVHLAFHHFRLENASVVHTPTAVSPGNSIAMPANEDDRGAPRTGESSPSADRLLALTTALELEMGMQPRGRRRSPRTGARYPPSSVISPAFGRIAGQAQTDGLGSGRPCFGVPIGPLGHPNRCAREVRGSIRRRRPEECRGLGLAHRRPKPARIACNRALRRLESGAGPPSRTG